MRKFLTILALCCLLFLVGGYHLLYQFRLAEIKSAVKKELINTRRTELTELVFTTSGLASLDWESKTEFRYQNTMFDVVEIEKKDGKTVCWCLADAKETALVDQYLKTQNSSSEKSPSQSLFKLLKAPFLPVTVLKSEIFLQEKLTSFSLYAFSLLATPTQVLTPPPRVC
ncbi:hypothetical protein [Flavisolibacter ginsenosidimutans]|uniref:Uncharacterized protein n=1 Tax=Flavisolibacter ginsenosidimutans TaxID=661481 RepID=A0A5B8UF29_9BACT|nr:hypothetical protein [Flavisolibacter ginsenosidimutans]QEC55042.1 hypothetical protein FSB75_03690 [Flavisolibacter ginsenosidimutans]